MDIQVNKFSQDIINFVKLIREYIGEFYEKGLIDFSPDKLNGIEMLILLYNKQKMITDFINHSCEHWDKIIGKDKEFLSKGLTHIFYNSIIKDVEGFLGVNSTKDLKYSLEKFCNLFDSKDENGDPVFNDDKMKSIWTHLDSFIKTSVKYIHYSRCPTLRKIDETHVKRVWTNSSYKEVDIIKFCKHYNISLDW